MTITHPDRRRGVPRKEAMLARRIRQRSANRDFIPVPNARIEARIRATEGLLTIAYSNGPGPMPSPVLIHHEAVRTVARTLPATPIGVRTNYNHPTSKYNQENTRGKR